MKKTAIFAAVAFTAFLMACTNPAGNAPANANAANTAAKPAAPPTADALMAIDKAANEAWAKGDTKWFEDNLSDKFVMYERGTRMTKDDAVKMIGSAKCDIKSMNFTEPAMTKINDDTYAITYKGEFDGSCTMDGKSQKVPSPVRATSIAVRDGDKWKGVFHAETPIIDPKNPPAPAKAADDKKADTKPADDKKAAANKEDATKSDDKAADPAGKDTAPTAPAKSANTDALVKMHTAGWEAFKAKDAKWFEANTTSGLAVVDPMGGFHTSKADIIKTWTETMKCEGITKVSVTDGVATTISPTVELLTLKGSADGTCDGQKNGDLYQTAVYVKEGNAWKLAFMFESPAM